MQILNLRVMMMSEKRFKSTLDEDTMSIMPYLVSDNGKKMTYEQVVDLLNELNEENQRLKNDCSILVQSNQEYRKENEQLQKETVFLAYWKRKAMILLMQVRRLTPRMTDEEVMEFSKELDDE